MCESKKYRLLRTSSLRKCLFILCIITGSNKLGAWRVTFYLDMTCMHIRRDTLRNHVCIGYTVHVKKHLSEPYFNCIYGTSSETSYGLKVNVYSLVSRPGLFSRLHTITPWLLDLFIPRTFSTPWGAYSPCCLLWRWELIIYINRLCPIPDTYCLLGRESTQADKVSCPETQWNSTIYAQPTDSNLPFLACKSLMLPLRHDALPAS